VSDVGTLKTDLDTAELLITGNAGDISDLEPSLPLENYYGVLADDKVLVPTEYYNLVKADVKAGEIVEISGKACF